MRKCIYCGKELNEDFAVDVCSDCGERVWGKKMFTAIKENMSNARKNGDLFQGSVTDCNENLKT